MLTTPSILRDQIIKYSLVGVANLIVGLAVIIGLTYNDFSPVVANIGGYSCGLLVSFFLNRRYTFSVHLERRSGVSFLIAFFIAYSANLLVLHLSAPLSSINRLIPQLAAMLVYNITFFIQMKFWVFRRYG
jgi:putative flippase GtrA